jgi:hypothetical protein
MPVETPPGLFSQLDISGFGEFQGTIDLDFIDGFAPKTGDSFDLINAFGGADFTAANFQIGGLEPGFEYTDTFSDGQFDLVADNNAVSTPEPSSALLLVPVLAALFLVGLRKKLMVRS